MLFLPLFPVGFALAVAGEALRSKNIQSKMTFAESSEGVLFNMGGLGLLGVGAVIMVLALMSFIV